MVKSQDTICSHLFFNVNALASLGVLIFMHDKIYYEVL